jgi:hypothetical protein
MGIREWIKDTTAAFAPWAGDIQRAEAHRAAPARLRELAEPGAEQRHEIIASNYHAGRIDRDEYEWQRDALIASEAERIRVAEAEAVDFPPATDAELAEIRQQGLDGLATPDPWDRNDLRDWRDRLASSAAWEAAVAADEEMRRRQAGIERDRAEAGETGLDEPAPGQSEAWAADQAAAGERLDELERQQAAAGRDVFGFPLESAEVSGEEADRIQADQEASWEAASEEVPEAELPADFDPFAAPEDWLPDGTITQRGEIIGSWQPKGSEPATATYRADAPDDTANYRGVTPEGEWWEPKYPDKTGADRTQYLGDKAAELAEAGDGYRDEITGEMTADGVSADGVRQVVETASAWRESDHRAGAYMDREAGR